MAAASSLTGLHDILYHILSHLTPDPKPRTVSLDEPSDSKSARKALARLARAHSSFTQPALALMWRSLPSQEPLEGLLCVVGIARRPPLEQWYPPPLEMCGTPTTHESGWKRFQEYACLVREIIIDPFEPSVTGLPKLLEDTCWWQLHSVIGNAPILPNLQGAILRSLNWWRSVDGGMLRLLNSSIREIDILFPRADRDDVRHLGRGLAGCFSSMKNLEVLSIQVSHPAPFLNIEPLPQRHPCLRHLKLGPDTYVELNHLRPLAALPDLEYLGISLTARDPPNLQITLPALRRLEVLSCWGFNIVGALLARVETPQLRTFSFTEKHDHTSNVSQELPTHLHTLVTKCPFLTGFRWSSEHRSYLGRFHVPLAELVAPLLSHRAMRSLAMHLEGSVVPFSPADLRAMAEAWSDLETFHLHDEGVETASRKSDGGRAQVEQYADLESIVAFARHCPRLRSLRVPVVRLDSSSDSESTLANLLTDGVQPPAPHRLRELSVEHVDVIRSGDSGSDSEQDGDRRRELGGVLFRGLMEKVFPFANIRDRYWVAGTATRSVIGVSVGCGQVITTTPRCE